MQPQANNVVFVAGTAPRLLAPLQDMTVESDRPVEITCQFEASPTPTIQWLREGATIKPSTDFAVRIKSKSRWLLFVESFSQWVFGIN